MRARRIAFILEASENGSAKHVLQLCHGCLARGWEVLLMYSPARADEKFCEGIRTLALWGNVRPIPIEFGHSLAYGVTRTLRSLRRELNSNQPIDVIHCHSGKAGLFGRLALHNDAKGMVYTPHAGFTMNPERAQPLRFLAKWVELGLSALTDAIICVSDEEVHLWRAIGVSSSKLHNIPNGIDPSEAADFAMRQKLRDAAHANESIICLGFVGRLFPQKAPANLLRAFELVARALPQRVKLLMVGDGPLLPSLLRLAQQLGIEQQVAWLGYQDGRAAMQAFDVFVLPSLYEGFPYVLLEALQEGLPVVTTAIGGARAMVQDGINGFVVPVNDPRQLADAITQIIAQPDLRAGMRAKSREIAQRFTVHRMLIKTIEIYDLILAKQKNR